MLVVGDQKEIDIGDGKHRCDAREAGARAARSTTLPLRDPLTMKRVRSGYFRKALTNSFKSIGLLLLIAPVMKSLTPGV